MDMSFSFLITVIIVLWMFYNEIRIYQYKKRLVKAVKLYGGGYFYGGGFIFHLLLAIGLIVSIGISAMLLFVICIVLSILTSTLHTYVGQDGIIVGGRFYEWEKVDVVEIKKFNNNYNMFKHTLIIKLSSFSWKMNSLVSESQLADLESIIEREEISS